MEGNQTILSRPKANKTSSSLQETGDKNPNIIKAFTFDKSYWSAEKSDANYADQEHIYNDIGRDLLNHAFDGYNCCIFAYGQTGSGKSYTMMGYGQDKGIIPRICQELFERIALLSKKGSLHFQVEVSYLEIYNEKVRDLLNPGNKGNLKVREHPTIGPYVEDLARLIVSSYKDMEQLIHEGNQARTVAATKMNETSSRSHAVFTIFLTSLANPEEKSEKSNKNSGKVARISLVDLAGSERVNSTGATGIRLKEGANINKSLATLGKVIAALAEQSTSTMKSTAKRRASFTGGKSASPSTTIFIPYRDSVLTWLLKDSLGGNSKTTMIATISPTDYEETLSTLRYADQAKHIKNKPIVNEDPNARLIRELKEELQALRDTLKVYVPEEVLERITLQQRTRRQSFGSSRTSSRNSSIRESSVSPMLLISPESPAFASKEELMEQLETSEKLLATVNETWEEKMKRTEAIHAEREKALEALGVIVEKDNMGIYAPKTVHLINLNEDPLMTECLMYQIKPGITRVGRLGSQVAADIRLSGSEISDEHCYFENLPLEEDISNTNKKDQEIRHLNGYATTNGGRTVTIYPNKQAVTLVNGLRISEPKVLHSGYRIIFGSGLQHLFRFNNPDEVKRERDHQQQQLKLLQKCDDSNSSKFYYSHPPDIIDWNFAHNEALRNFGSQGNADLTKMTDEDLKQLSDGITKIRESRNKDRLSSDSNSLYSDSIDSNIIPRASVSSTATSICKTDAMFKKAVLATKYALMKQQMERTLEEQKKAYESKIKRISAHLPPGTQLSSDDLHVGYNAKNAPEALQRWVIEKWRKLRYVKMAEDCLVHAVLLKEANVMARELKKGVIYQFIVVHDDLSASHPSFWEPTSSVLYQGSINSYNDAHLLADPKPCLAVQVIDKLHCTTYIWSIAKLKRRLQQMHKIYDYAEDNNKSLLTQQHFNREDPFHEILCPRYALIGLARVPLQNLTVQLHADNYVDIYCRNSGRVMGQVRVMITPIARRGLLKQRALSEKYLLHTGQQQVFEVRIQELKGINESDFTQVHAQFRLSSFGNVERLSPADKMYQTDPVSGFGEGSVIEFGQCQTLSINITSNMMDVILNQGLTIEIHGRMQEQYLQHSHQPQRTDSNLSSNRRVPLLRNFSTDQHTYNGILMRERHDILAWIQIRELNSQGEYCPVKVLHYESHETKKPHYLFCLRQGLQRRISLTLLHDSGSRLNWKEIKNLKLGNIRWITIKSEQQQQQQQEEAEVLSDEDASFVNINLLPKKSKTLLGQRNTSTLTVEGAWDSSLHDSLQLDRTTPSGKHVCMTLTWQITQEKSDTPLTFSTNIMLQMDARDKTLASSISPSSLFKQFLLAGSGHVKEYGSATKIMNKASVLFTVELKPRIAKNVKDLWRLDTSKRYVRGEEYIGAWVPKGVSLINEYKAARQQMLFREEVASFRQSMLLHQPKTNAAESSLLRKLPEKRKLSPMDEKKLLLKVIDLWQRKFGEQEEIVLNQDPPNLSSPSATSTGTNNNEELTKVKLLAHIQQVYPSDTVTKKGHLLFMENASQSWLNRWLVLRR
ncbi:hypothetical protein BDF20DRAFT_829796 [Mycotypha africana]|uniref:uncharacterized protein n=1 Tax=Mycotypha africana TaxID=64632 RepID=UPI0023007D56|nr:uncharacterized protein BDF20DRAFT_829796 [Mycotypha africana]KAI8967250.1 hypothetical protein BDF20DRAFT_829796 [Mycotypha africana]